MPERMISVNGAQLWVAEQGSGSPLVLCGGGPGCCDYLEPVAAMVDDLVRVYRYEPRGCGRSSPTGPFDLQTCVADLDALRAALGHERWLVGGHSWGATLALAYALEFPRRVPALVYLSGAGVQNDREWHAAYQAGREANLERQVQFAYPPNLEVNRVANASTRAFIKEPGLLRRIADLDVPVLAIHGGGDIRPSWPVQQLAHLMPNARFELIEGADHHLWLTHPDELRPRLRAFLRELQVPWRDIRRTGAGRPRQNTGASRQSWAALDVVSPNNVGQGSVDTVMECLRLRDQVFSALR